MPSERIADGELVTLTGAELRCWLMAAHSAGMDAQAQLRGVSAADGPERHRAYHADGLGRGLANWLAARRVPVEVEP